METGLNLIPRTSAEANIINEFFENSNYFVEYQPEFGQFFIPEESEYYDALEVELGRDLAELNVNYRIEGIF